MATSKNEQDPEREVETNALNIINISSSVVVLTLQQQENNQESTETVATASDGDFVKLADQDRSRDRAEAKMTESNYTESHEIFQELYSQLKTKWEKLKLLFRMSECDVMRDKYMIFTHDLSAMDNVLCNAKLEEMAALSQRLKPFPQIFLSCVALQRITSKHVFEGSKQELSAIKEWLELIKGGTEEISSSSNDRNKTKNKLISITVGRYLEELDKKRRETGINDEFKVESSAWFLRCIAMCYFYAGEERKSVEYSLKVEKLMTSHMSQEQAEEKRIFAISISNAAYCYSLIHENEKANELSKRALDLYEKVTDWDNEVQKQVGINISASTSLSLD